eukprot:gene14262-biopygen4890
MLHLHQSGLLDCPNQSIQVKQALEEEYGDIFQADRALAGGSDAKHAAPDDEYAAPSYPPRSPRPPTRSPAQLALKAGTCEDENGCEWFAINISPRISVRRHLRHRRCLVEREGARPRRAGGVGVPRLRRNGAAHRLDPAGPDVARDVPPVGAEAGAALSSACPGDTPSDTSMGEGGEQLDSRRGDPVGIP